MIDWSKEGPLPSEPMRPRSAGALDPLADQPVPGATTLYFIRHGKVENPGKVVYERIPGFHLSALGRRQAQATARFLASDLRVTEASAFIASPLDRTMDTAEIIQKPVNRMRVARGLEQLEISTDERLIEAWNYYKGQRIGHGQASALKWANLRRYLDLRTPGWGEPYEQIAARMADFAFEAADRYAGQSVIVVSHESPIWTLRRYLETGRAQSNVLTRGTALASVTALSIEPGTHRLVCVAYADPAAGVE